MLTFLPEEFRKTSFKDQVLNLLKEEDVNLGGGGSGPALSEDFEKKTKEDIVMNRIKLIENTREIHRLKQELNNLQNMQKRVGDLEMLINEKANS